MLTGSLLSSVQFLDILKYQPHVKAHSKWNLRSFLSLTEVLSSVEDVFLGAKLTHQILPLTPFAQMNLIYQGGGEGVFAPVEDLLCRVVFVAVG